MFIDKNGLLDLDSIILQNKSYQKIMEDEIVTPEEIREQAELVDKMLEEMKGKYSDVQFREIQQLLAEVSVLYFVNSIYDNNRLCGES